MQNQSKPNKKERSNETDNSSDYVKQEFVTKNWMSLNANLSVQHFT